MAMAVVAIPVAPPVLLFEVAGAAKSSVRQ